MCDCKSFCEELPGLLLGLESTPMFSLGLHLAAAPSQSERQQWLDMRLPEESLPNFEVYHGGGSKS